MVFNVHSFRNKSFSSKIASQEQPVTLFRLRLNSPQLMFVIRFRDQSFTTRPACLLFLLIWKVCNNFKFTAIDSRCLLTSNVTIQGLMYQYQMLFVFLSLCLQISSHWS